MEACFWRNSNHPYAVVHCSNSSCAVRSMSIIIHRIIITIYIINSTSVIIRYIRMIIIYSCVDDCNLNSATSVVSMNNLSVNAINTPWKLLRSYSYIDYIIIFNIFHIRIFPKRNHSF